MKKTIIKEFTNEKWFKCFNQAERFILEYGLDLIKMTIEKKGDVYVATIEYGLGVRDD